MSATAEALQFDAAEHRYTLGERRLPSVTDALAPLRDYAGIPDDVLEKARQRGHALHMAIRLYNEDDLDIGSLDTEIVPLFEAWKKFLIDTGFKVSGFETPLHSRLYQFAGTPDLYGKMGTGLWVPDIKATAMIPPWTSVQTAAYRQLLQENGSVVERPRRAALHLRKDGQYRFEPYPPAKDSEDFQTFLACLRVYQWRLQHGSV